MSYYMLMLRGEKIDFASYSPEEMQKLLADFDSWNTKMIRENRMIASGNLPVRQGKTIRMGPVVSDGPYAEAKEAVTGFFLISAENDAMATEMASGCPFLPRGGSVEVRPVPHLEFEDAAKLVLEESVRARAAQKGQGA